LNLAGSAIMNEPIRSDSPTLSELPTDELIQYGRSLGLPLPVRTARGEALRRIRARQELLLTLDRDAMFDVVVWLRAPVRKSAGKEQLAETIYQHHPIRFDGLSDRGLRVYAALAGVTGVEHRPRDVVLRQLRKVQGIGTLLRTARSRVIGAMVSKLLPPDSAAKGSDYRFLPDDPSSSTTTLHDQIVQTGFVGGVARKIKGVADDYVREKLDEIEQRIDRKLDEIDERLGEWRDREMTHRLRIIKVTLLASILVALLSLLYDYLHR